MRFLKRSDTNRAVQAQRLEISDLERKGKTWKKPTEEFLMKGLILSFLLVVHTLNTDMKYCQV